MAEYRTDVPLSTTTDYWFVTLGRLGGLTEGGSWPFPTEAAAVRFADNHKLIAISGHDVDRDVSIRSPDGSVRVVDLS